MWYKSDGAQKDVILSSRVRFARNVDGYVFSTALTTDKATELIERTKSVSKDFSFIDFSESDSLTAQSFAEKRIVSSNFASATAHRVLLQKNNTYIMLPEEDHIRLQVILPGFAVKQAYSTAYDEISQLAESLSFSFDPKLGYLTHCPTNLGTAMRAGAMLFLPALTMFGKMNELIYSLPRMGFAIRGMYGEGSGGGACLYQISNQVTMGISCEDTITKLEDILTHIVENELELRHELHSKQYDSIRDMVLRSYGALKYAHSMTSDEFMKHYVNIRLGVSYNYQDLSHLSAHKIDQLMIEIMPHTLSISQNLFSPHVRDIARAKVIREFMKGNPNYNDK